MNTNESATPVWFITGCSSGLGRALAEAVLRHGHRCVPTARNPADIADIVRAHPKTSLALGLDVTDDKQRRDAVARAEEAFGGIDVLVNNAGHGYSAAIEEGEEGEIRRMFETNFFALAAVTRRVLSGMRARGSSMDSSGVSRIISSLTSTTVAGAVGNPIRAASLVPSNSFTSTLRCCGLFWNLTT